MAANSEVVPVDFPEAFDDWNRRKDVAERYFVPWVDRAYPLAGATILEYGSGRGAVTGAFAPYAERYIGLDIDAADVAEAQRILESGGVHPEFVVAPPQEIFAATRAYAGEVDVFLCYAVFEHMSSEERQELFRVAREVVKPEGVIVIIETPNRLTPWDYHTSRVPFFDHLPEEIAKAYFDRSPREDFVEGWSAAKAAGDDALQEAFVRWGRGMSYHELELAFDELPAHIVSGSWDPLLWPERQIYRDELALQHVMDAARPDLPALFSRYWLDLILRPTPASERTLLLRPWAMETYGSTAADCTSGGYVVLHGPESSLSVRLPVATDRLVVITDEFDGDPVQLTVTNLASGVHEQRPAHGLGQIADMRFDEPASHFELKTDRGITLSFVGYEA